MNQPDEPIDYLSRAREEYMTALECHNSGDSVATVIGLRITNSAALLSIAESLQSLVAERKILAQSNLELVRAMEGLKGVAVELRSLADAEKARGV